MTKKIGTVIVFLMVLTLLLTSCKLPASTPPATEEAKTTPIILQTDSTGGVAQTPESKTESTATLAIYATPTSTPEPTEVIVIPTLTRPAEYTIKAGEFIYCLARRFDMNPNDILDLNNLGESLLSPGDVLKMPQTGNWPGESRSVLPHPTTHTVASGDTIYTIACEYGDVSPEAIIAANQLEEPYTLTPGQTLQIP